jgi:hypothetical protein
MRNRQFANVQLVAIFLSLAAIVSSNENTTIIVLMGESVQLNCTIQSVADSLNNQIKFKPTWLKADAKYNEHGKFVDYKTENIIVTRKGLIVDAFRDKIKLKTVRNQVQILTITHIGARDEGKYICRGFNSNNDKFYFIQVHGKRLQKFNVQTLFFFISMI